ncbi:hypothetical protein I350_06553 [Cryptococcus amylolentus CBS 6273]|uniref:amidase n=1 Tax=Cryptococcus amylolentus CBS 6273 TaxID=1296118 RepID=A0A1E3JM44_9TREE|nr:hypothetical protein I350_06553 [Cryptococcus amylolentus CBS 6273]
MTIDNWKLAVERKLQRRNALFPKDYLIPAHQLPDRFTTDVTEIPKLHLSALETEITELDDCDRLLSNIARGVWTAKQVMVAFCKRATMAHQLVNCLNEVFFESALARADELDNILATTGRTVGPLHGLPISMKDQFCLKGHETACGYVHWLDQRNEEDSVLVQILYQQGAIPFVSTNLPQSMHRVETENNIYGRTDNPFNRALTCGGSSGGEGALVGIRGSCVGVGTDLGGSIRVPAGFQGLYGLRPSFHRIPYYGAKNSLLGFETLPSVAGPISTSFSGLVNFTKAVVDATPSLLDPEVLDMPWKELKFASASAGPKAFAVMWNDGVVKPNPPIRRALEETVRKLRAAGHEVIDWVPCDYTYAGQIAYSLVTSDGGHDVRTALELSGEPKLPSLHKASEMISTYEEWQVNKRKLAYRKRHLDHWNATSARTSTGRPIDAIISPIAPYAAPPHGENTYVGYTAIWNFLDNVAAVFPVTKVDPVRDAVPISTGEPLSELDAIHAASYSPQRYENAPVSLQIIGRRQHEEEVLGLLKQVMTAIKCT